MPLTMNEAHSKSLYEPRLEPGEQVKFMSFGNWFPGGAIGRFFQFLPILAKPHFVVGTDRRLLIFKLSGFTLKEQEFHAAPWSEVRSVHVGWGIINKTVHYETANYSIAIVSPRAFFGIAKHLTGASGVESAYQQIKGLPA